MLEYISGLSLGAIIGFAMAVPVGPVGLICIQRTLSKNRISGLISGCGAAVADVLLASIGAFSITYIFTFIDDNKSILQITGGFLLLFLGILSLISKPKIKEVHIDTTLGLIQEFLSAFIITITNPFSAFSFFIAFAAVNKTERGLAFAITFLIGIFIGSCIWWVILTHIADKIAHKMNHERITYINRWFAKLIIAFSLVILFGVLFRQF